MIRLPIMGFVLLALVMFGCGQSDESKSKETVTEKVVETAKSAAEETREMAAATAEKTEEMAAATAEKTEEMANQAAEGAKQVMADSKETATEAADTAVEKATAAAVATTMAAEKAVNAAQQAVTPETIVLEASYGNVTFPHAMHQASYACAACHGEGTPGLFGLDKEKAHVLCKDCHKEEGAGPTGCKGCHKK